MHAIVIEEFGPPEVLVSHEVQSPTLGPDHVLIDVEFAGVTFVETQIRRGRAPHPSMLPQLPAILGNGVGGTVTAAGSDVGRDLLGARVVSTTDGTGGYARLASVPATAVIRVPDELRMADAVALLADGRTAIVLIDRAGIGPQDSVLIEAAAGGVGSLLLQLAKRAGAYVVAAAGGKRKLELARSLGADLVVDYRQPSWTRNVETAATKHGFDVVFDGVGGSIGRDAFELLGRGGRLFAFGMASGGFAAIDEQELNDRGVTRLRGALATPEEMSSLSQRALSSAAAGDLRPVIGQKVPLANAADAHRAIESRATIGKTLLVP